MWIVDIALRRPYTFIVMALCILLGTPLTLMRMSTDILPEINIPVVSMVWYYNGLSAQEMGSRITSVSERALTTLVNDIEHIESQSLPGVAVIKIFLQPNASVPAAIAQTVAIGQTQLKQLPPGITPPLVIQYSASSVPVVQLGVTHPDMSENEVFDTSINFLRPQLVTIPGAAVPYPYGGRSRVVAIDLDNKALLARGLSAADVVNAVNVQNLILPSGTAKLGELERNVSVEGSTSNIQALNDIPVKTKNGITVRLSEVAYVHDGSSPQVNVVRQDGKRGTLLSVIKNGGASTLSIVSTLYERLPQMIETLPKGINVKPLFDQSIFVKAAIQGVIHEALTAAALTAAMILLFLGNWRSTLIIAVSIPLSIFCSLMALSALGQTINLMSLGGLALAVGILVDDATVTIENIERHLHMGTPLFESIRDGAGEIALPALVSTLCICIVFIPMFLLSGVAKYLFVPLAEAVVFAMLASYVLSRTLVPTMAMLMMNRNALHAPSGWLGKIHKKFNQGFDALRELYTALLSKLLDRKKMAGGAFLLFCLGSCALYPFLGQDFFPNVDSGKIRLHLRAPTGTRIEETARITDKVEARIRTLVNENEVDTILDNIGVPISGINLTYSNAGTIGSLDSEVLISLKPNHRPTEEIIRILRADLPQSFPGIECFFQPADIVTQILNFGSPAALDVQFNGNNIEANYRLANELAKKLKTIPGAVDVHVQQRLDEPTLALQMDRTRLQQQGLSGFNVAQNVLVTLSGSSQTAPAFWLNPKNGVVYNVAIQTPQTQVDSIDDLMNTPVTGSSDSPGPSQILGNLVTASPKTEMAIVSHYDIKPVVDVFVSVDGRDLGSVAREVDRLIEDTKPHLARGSQLNLRGQVQTMRSSFIGLGLGLIGAIILVYLLIVVNFQSWTDPFIIITALPAALAGIAWMLFLTGTTLSVPALTGAIMTMGVATANSILVVAFARTLMDQGLNARAAALSAGATRIRPVLMTAAAMIIGMIPMALGLGEGGEQNAPLGRATIGGLLFATLSTLLFVPLVFALIHGWLEKRKPSDLKRL